MQRLSFLHQNLPFLTEQSARLVKSNKRVVGLWKNKEGGIEILSLVNGNKSHDTLIDPQLLDQVEGSRSNQSRINWLTDEEVPFQFLNHKVIQLDLNSEYERNVLMLGFTSPIDGKFDLIFIYLERELGQFGMTRENRPIRAEERLIIAKLLLDSLDNLQELNQSNKKIYTQVIGMKQGIQSDYQILKNELEQKERNLARGFENYAEYIIERIATSNRVNIRLTKRAYDKLGKFEGKFSDLEKSLEASAIVAINSLMDLDQDVILDESDIHLSIFKEEKVLKRAETAVVGRLTKTHQLLDKYEEAAIQAQRNGDKIIGRVIGSYCSPSISNAAITDSLKNHGERIWELMKKYPEKWQTIRNGFKSVLNVVAQYDELNESKLVS